MRVRYSFYGVLLTLLTIGMVTAQDNCPVVVQEILQSVADSCAGLGRNQVCYGNNSVTATDASDAMIDAFESPGDVVDVFEIGSLSTAPFDSLTSQWGVALLSLQANLPDTLPGQNVTFVVFGDVTINDESDGAMQAFRLSTGIGQPDCEDVPRNGVLIQSPTDTEVELRINGIELVFGSTGFVEVDGDDVTVSTFDGTVSMTADGETQTAEPGYTTTASESDAPSEPEPYDYEDVDDMPVELLPEAVSVPFPVDPNSDWIDTGIAVEAGDTVELSATGMVNVWVNCEAEKIEADQPDIDCTSLIFDANGGDVRSVSGEFIGGDMSLFPVDDAPPHSLVGRIGDTTFFVGDSATITVESSGTLAFRLNDVDDNNAGNFIVTIEVIDG